MTSFLDLLAWWIIILVIISFFGFLVGLGTPGTEHEEKDLKNVKDVAGHDSKNYTKAGIASSNTLEHTPQIIITDIPNNWSPSAELFGHTTKKNVNR